MTQTPLIINGAHGEGGGQILRTAVSLAAILQRPIRIENIRAGRPKPGLAAQHLTAVRAVAALCEAEIAGDFLGSTALDFRPRRPPAAGRYRFDVGDARPGGSAGSATLIAQALALPLLHAGGTSLVTILGGTHLDSSPPYDFLQDVWQPALRRLGAPIELMLKRWGWFPIGQGEIDMRIAAPSATAAPALTPLRLEERGKLRRVTGRAVAARLPEHIPQRMASHAARCLEAADIETLVLALSVDAACPGAGIFLTAEYENIRCGFSAFGRRGKPSEVVADEAVRAVLRHHALPGVLDLHLADQLLMPLALACGPSNFVVAETTRHLETNAWVIEAFGVAYITIDTGPVAVRVSVEPRSTGRRSIEAPLQPSRRRSPSLT